ncbi:MAG TPA: DUF892 family protein [Gammaproteobacteria bacterium]
MRTMIADRGMGEPISLGAALAAGKKVAPDVTGLLAEDHRTVLGWFAWYESAADPEVKLRVTRSICKALRAHMAAEEEFFYPEAQRHIGDEELIERSLREHQGAKALLDRLEAAAAADATHADLMRELRAEIEAHVHEEEAQLFPKVRATDMDRYDVGRAAAARRVERLFELADGARTAPQRNGQPVKEHPVMAISKDVARRYFIVGAKNAHATAKEGRKMVDLQIKRLQHYPRLKEKLESHAKEKDAQLQRLETILDAVGEKPSAVKDTAMALIANMGSMANAAAGDEVLKSSFAMLGLAKAGAAAYETLILCGEAAGIQEALRPLQQCLSEERGMGAFIEENLRGVGMGFLQLESEGAPASR